MVPLQISEWETVDGVDIELAGDFGAVIDVVWEVDMWKLKHFEKDI